MTNWPEISIEKLKANTKNAIAMGPFGSRIKAENFVKDGIPVIKGGNLNGSFILENKFDFLTEQKATELRTSNAFRRDIVITHRGTIGQVGIIPDNSKFERYVVSQSQLKVSLNQEKVNPYFVYYFLRSPLGQQRLLSNASQVGVPAIAQASTSVKAILVPCPDKEIQDKVAEILLTLDNKIAVNHQTNQTLEQIAQAIFKSWFVDFEPVKAKQHIRSLGGNKQQSEHAAEAIIAGAINLETITSTTDLSTLYQKITQALNKNIAHQSEAQRQQLTTTASNFPNKLIDSQLGPIPDGWKAAVLSKMIEIIGGGTPKKSEPLYWDGNIPWFSVKDTPAVGQVYVLDTDLKITEKGINESSTKLLYEGTTIITARGTVGKIAFVGTPMAMNQSCYGIIGSDGISPIFNYFNIKSAVDALQQNTHGAVFDTITRATFDTIDRVIPQLEVIKSFESVTEPLFHKIKSNVLQSKSLSQIRDLLLPRLLSGELTRQVKL